MTLEKLRADVDAKIAEIRLHYASANAAQRNAMLADGHDEALVAEIMADNAHAQAALLIRSKAFLLGVALGEDPAEAAAALGLVRTTNDNLATMAPQGAA